MFRRNKNKKIIEALDILEEFVKHDRNDLPDITYNSSQMDLEIKEKFTSLFNTIKEKNKEELTAYGELLLITERIVRGDFDDRITKINTSNPMLNYLANNVNTLVSNLKKNFNLVTDILNEYSNNNFINKLDTSDIVKDFKEVFDGVNTLQKTITNILYDNKSNGLKLSNGSNILLENVNTLNISSNTAASSIEETAAALEQITANIQNNTKNVTEMSNYSNEVTLSANHGEKLANQTNVAMDEINEQVNAINEAITVIDQISFQTNILSLNAAVEAATAGEAGKGFAVVAAEVRNLANRSTQAAKEIKDLVENATAKANQGKNIANDMINGYIDLNKNISNTINLIQNIESSSKEQLTGIEQINIAINQLDRQIQENVQIASKTNDVALSTNEIAKIILEDANEKEFEGKDKLNTQ